MNAGEGADRFLEHDGARLRWRLEGSESGTGPPLVLIHGWALSLEYWNPVLSMLAASRKVLRYDRRGFGLTRGPYNPAKACGDLLALLDAARLEDPVLVGMSQGARVAIHTSILAPQRVTGLVLDGAPWFEDETELPITRYRHLRESAGLGAMREAILEHALMQPVPPNPAKRALLSTCVDHYVGADLEGGWSPVPDPDLKSIRQPALIINGTQDGNARLIAGQKLSAAMPWADRVELPGTGHLSALDDPPAWAEAVLGFLELE